MDKDAELISASLCRGIHSAPVGSDSANAKKKMQSCLHPKLFKELEPTLIGESNNLEVSMKAKAIPEGFHSFTPDLVVRDVAAAIEFCCQALVFKRR